MDIFTLFGRIAIDNAMANDAIEETTGKASSAGTKIVQSFKKIGSAIATYFAVEKVVGFGKECIEAAANAQAMTSQFNQVFSELSAQATGTLGEIATSAGVAENRLMGSFTQIAAFAKTTGMDTQDALALSERAMYAVADSAAFYDRSLEEVTESLQSFLKGNYENDAALGLSCTEITRNTAANELYGKSFQDLSEAQKQLTLLKMVEDANAASGALGQAARESDTWNNKVGNLKQAWTDFKAVIGENFLDPAIAAINGVTEAVVWLTEKVPEVIDWFKEMSEKLGEYWDFVKDAIGNAHEAITVFFAETIPQAWKDMIESVKSKWDEVTAWIDNSANAVLSFFGINMPSDWSLTGSIVSAWNSVISAINSAIDAVARFLGMSGGSEVFSDHSAYKGGSGQAAGYGLPSSGGTSASAVAFDTASPTLNAKIPGFATGLDFVPKDNFLARLHYGEAVLTKSEADVWRNGGDDSSVVHIQQLTASVQQLVDELPDMLANAFASMKFDVNNREFARLVRAVN